MKISEKILFLKKGYTKEEIKAMEDAEKAEGAKEQEKVPETGEPKEDVKSPDQESDDGSSDGEDNQVPETDYKALYESAMENLKQAQELNRQMNVFAGKDEPDPLEDVSKQLDQLFDDISND